VLGQGRMEGSSNSVGITISAGVGGGEIVCAASGVGAVGVTKLAKAIGASACATPSGLWGTGVPPSMANKDAEVVWPDTCVMRCLFALGQKRPGSDKTKQRLGQVAR
jgi:hypothetical protein